MIYRINYKNFLLHMIDHFDYDELLHMQYLIISAKLANSARVKNVVKCNDLYPDYDIMNDWYSNQNMDTFERAYLAVLNGEDIKDNSNNEVTWIDSILWNYFLLPISKHHDVIIICDEQEDFIIDVLCKFLKKRLSIEVINLNELFTKGSVGPVYIDRDKIWDKGVDIKRAALRDKARAMQSTEEGRAKLIGMMNKSEKIKALKKAGYTVKKSDEKDLDSMLMEAWNQEAK